MFECSRLVTPSLSIHSISHVYEPVVLGTCTQCKEGDDMGQREDCSRDHNLWDSTPVGGKAPTLVVFRRAYVTARVVWAAILLLFPRRVLRAVDRRPDGNGVAVARALGARHTIQAVVELTTGQRWQRDGVAIDLLHATSMLAVAGFNARWRRAALADFVAASTFALWGLSLQRHSPSTKTRENPERGQ